MGSKNKPGKFDCFAAAHPDEPMFILLGRDRSAGSLVRAWAKERMVRNGLAGNIAQDLDKVEEALACAVEMDEWAHLIGKEPQILSMYQVRDNAFDTIAQANALLVHTLTPEERQSENPPGLLERIRRSLPDRR